MDENWGLRFCWLIFPLKTVARNLRQVLFPFISVLVNPHYLGNGNSLGFLSCFLVFFSRPCHRFLEPLVIEIGGEHITKLLNVWSMGHQTHSYRTNHRWKWAVEAQSLGSWLSSLVSFSLNWQCGLDARSTLEHVRMDFAVRCFLWLLFSFF